MSEATGAPDGRQAYELELDEGCAVIFLEGLHSRAEANSVARELTKMLHHKIHKRGQRHLVVAVPPQVRLTIARGRRLRIEPQGDPHRVLFKIEDGREDSLIIRPGGY